MNPRLIYTSYDGDNIIYIDQIREFVIRHNQICLNPTHALGYYISTVAHKNSKLLAMQDCCAIENMADEFWLFTNTEEVILSALPEGVLIELLFWLETKESTTRIRIFDIQKVIDILKSEKLAYWGNELYLDDQLLSNALDTNLYIEIKNRVNELIKLRPTVFLDLDLKHIKYIDWIKLSVFETGFVPIVPHNLAPKPLYDAYGLDKLYSLSISLLKNRSEKYWNIVEHNEGNNVNVKSLKEMKVPKYINKDWALTTREVIL
jgi:hypothetical protein